MLNASGRRVVQFDAVGSVVLELRQGDKDVRGVVCVQSSMAIAVRDNLLQLGTASLIDHGAHRRRTIGLYVDAVQRRFLDGHAKEPNPSSFCDQNAGPSRWIYVLASLDGEVLQNT